MIIRDVPRPSVHCPECGSTDLFWHCAQQDEHGVYDWGTLATCNKCGTPISLEEDAAQIAREMTRRVQ